ncbi:trypsin alpha-3-like [Scaptodrosophila lebanonensis]|uniref:trypsin n=1 Tax=Drosophila lebanonensis TaxID=7225 RepID=A0A6J2UGS2_DROLE|nr:trypsin alpha-3-like [Scaptodrosophila lebanonensis]
MKFLILGLLFVGYAAASALEWTDPLARIVAGQFIDIEIVPWQVSLQANNEHVCGGVIFDKDIVVTAAHCVFQKRRSSLTIRAGSSNSSSGGQVVAVADIVIHENCSPTFFKNDISVLLLKNNLEFNKAVKSIEFANESPVDGATALVSGWGVIEECLQCSSNILKGSTMKIIGRNECISNKYHYGDFVAPDCICAYTRGEGPSGRDSGGPLVSNGKLVGLVYWGIGSGRIGYPTVFTDVAVHHKWILNTVAKLRKRNPKQIS